MSRLAKGVLAAAGFLGVAGVALAVGKGRASAAVVGAGAEETVPAGALRGAWTAEKRTWRVEGGSTTELVELSLSRLSGKGRWNSSETLPLAELRGLPASALGATASDVRFEWARDAGRFACEGRFEAGVGAGLFRFVPNPEYAADMKRRGYGTIGDDEAMRLALHDVSRSYVDGLARLGYERLTLDQLVSLRIHGASLEYVEGLGALGYPRLSADQLTSLRIHGASLEYVRELQALGFKDLPVDNLVSFRIHGVSPGYVRSFQGLGYRQLSPDQLVSMRIHGVSPEYVKQLRELGYEAVPVDDLVSMRIHNVTTDFVKRVQARSGRSVDVDRLVSLRIHGQE